VGRSLPLIGKNPASAFPILCKEDVRIRKGEDYSDNNRKFVGISVVIFDSRTSNYSFKTIS
jgi:hypothetical protein